MRLMTLNNTLTVSAQVEIEELAELKANGVNSLVCNRPQWRITRPSGIRDTFCCSRSAWYHGR